MKTHTYRSITRKIWHMKVNDWTVGDALCGLDTDRMKWTTTGGDPPTHGTVCKTCAKLAN